MPYKIVDKNQIVKEYERFSKDKTLFNQLDSNHQRIRDFFQNTYWSLKSQVKKDYELDLQLGIKFYLFLNNEPEFDAIYESDYLFWRYLAVYDIPDIIADRFGISMQDHFYKKSTRIYPYVLYWYINMSWQGNEIDTINVLKSNTTDEILQLVERTSKIGINLDFYRLLMKEYSLDKYDKLKERIKEKARKNGTNLTLFRLIMIKNTSKLLTFRPEIYPNGIHGYVQMLFEIE